LRQVLLTVKKDNYLSFAINGGSTEDPKLSTGDAVRLPIAVFYKFNDRFDVSGAAMAIKLGTAFITNREMSLAVDDHMEETFTIKAAPGNYQEQYTNNRIVKPLTLIL